MASTVWTDTSIQDRLLVSLRAGMKLRPAFRECGLSAGYTAERFWSALSKQPALEPFAAEVHALLDQEPVRPGDHELVLAAEETLRVAVSRVKIPATALRAAFFVLLNRAPRRWRTPAALTAASIGMDDGDGFTLTKYEEMMRCRTAALAERRRQMMDTSSAGTPASPGENGNSVS